MKKAVSMASMIEMRVDFDHPILIVSMYCAAGGDVDVVRKATTEGEDGASFISSSSGGNLNFVTARLFWKESVCFVDCLR